MIIYKIRNLWNFNSCPNCKIFKNCYFPKWFNFIDLMIFEIVKFGKFLKFSKLQIFRIFQIFQTANF